MSQVIPSSISLNDFTRLAESAGPDKALQVSGNRLSESGIFTSQAAKREAINAFVAALRTEYGDHVANMIDRTLVSDLREAGKPLTARLVQDLTRLALAEKTRMKEYNQGIVNKFLNGAEPEKSLDNAMEAYYAKNGITSPQDKVLLRERVQSFLLDKAGQGGFHPAILTAQALKQNVTAGHQDYTGFSLEHKFGAIKDPGTLPGTLQDRLRLADLGLVKGTSNFAFYRALMDLEAMRQIQPEGDLSPETVYQTLFNESAPQNLSGKDLIEAIATRCEDDKNALLARVENSKHGLIDIYKTKVSWETLASLMQRPKTISLADLPQVRSFFNREYTQEDMKGKLCSDLRRVSTTGPGGMALPPPTFTFRLDDGQGGTRTESIQVGKDTTFPFSNDADKAAYLQGRPNSLSNSLESFCREICGPGATEKQVTGTMLCLNQSALLPVKQLGGLAGTGFNEHSNRNVTLSRGEDGTILANFSSPEGQEARDAMGHFRMSLAINRDGEISVREFEVTPPLAVRQERNTEARIARVNEALALAAPYRALDDSPDGLLAQINSRALTLDPGARLTPELWSHLDSAIGSRIEIMAAESAASLTQEQILDLRRQELDTFFTKLEQVAAQVPEAQRGVFLRGCLELGNVPDVRLLPAIQQMTGTAAGVFKAILASRDGRDGAALLSNLYDSMRSTTKLEEDDQDFGAKAMDFEVARKLAMRMGVLRLMDGDNPDVFAKALTRPGPFRDMLHSLAKDQSEEGEFARQSLNLFRDGMTGILSDNTIASLEPHNIRERDLSLPRQREILGEGNYVARGADIAVPALAGLNQALRREMPVIRGALRTEVEMELRLGPGNQGGTSPGSRTENGLSEQFRKDFPRDGVFVNGRYYFPAPVDAPFPGTGTSEQDFINLFPDSRTAGLLSNLCSQSMYAIIMGAMPNAPCSRETSDAFMNHTFHNPSFLSAQAKRQQNIRIETLDADKGLYRIIALFGQSTNNPESGVERYMCELSTDVNLGAPSLPPEQRPQPTVENVHLDFLIRGREVVPGEA